MLLASCRRRLGALGTAATHKVRTSTETGLYTGGKLPNCDRWGRCVRQAVRGGSEREVYVGAGEGGRGPDPMGASIEANALWIPSQGFPWGLWGAEFVGSRHPG